MGRDTGTSARHGDCLLTPERPSIPRLASFTTVFNQLSPILGSGLTVYLNGAWKCIRLAGALFQ